MNNTELKPCPFCGGKVELVNYVERFVPAHSAAYIRCTKCNTRTKIKIETLNT